MTFPVYYLAQKSTATLFCTLIFPMQARHNIRHIIIRQALSIRFAANIAHNQVTNIVGFAIFLGQVHFFVFCTLIFLYVPFIYYLTRKSTGTLFCSLIFLYYCIPSKKSTAPLLCCLIFLYYYIPSILSNYDFSCKLTSPEIHNNYFVLLFFYTMTFPL